MPRVTRRYQPGGWLARARKHSLIVNWTTDTHIWRQAVLDGAGGANAIDTGGTRYYYQSADRFQSFVNVCNRGPIRPHLVLHTGDMIDGLNGLPGEDPQTDSAFAMAIWQQLDPTIASVLMLGNHDVAIIPPGVETQTQALAEWFGRDGAPFVAGSQFQQSFTVTGNGVTARFLMLDATLNSDGTHSARNTGQITAATKTWIAAELAASPENLIFICSHHGPQNWTIGGVSVLFNATDAADLSAIVDADRAANPNHRVQALFGHNHIQHNVIPWNTLSPNFPGYLTPAGIEGAAPVATQLFIDALGNLRWQMIPLAYPAT